MPLIYLRYSSPKDHYAPAVCDILSRPNPRTKRKTGAIKMKLHFQGILSVKQHSNRITINLKGKPKVISKNTTFKIYILP